jgi:hypothetical protein
LALRDPFDGFTGLTLSRRQHGVAVTVLALRA